MLEQPDIDNHALNAALQEYYALAPQALEFLPYGQDTQAAAYRVVEEGGAVYFLKASTRPLYEPSYFVPRYLADCGITAVVAPIATTSKVLWIEASNWRIALYPFVSGISGRAPVPTAKDWYLVGQTFKQIHQMPLPANGLSSIRQESFNPQPYFDWIATFETTRLTMPTNNSSADKLCSSWRTHQTVIHSLLDRLDKLGTVLQKEAAPLVICHADLHTGNLIRTSKEAVFVVDWDEVLLAPKERDFIFISPENTAFMEGYGAVEINWPVLTYYRCERAVQDLIEYTQIVFFREDLGEETKARAVERFALNFARGGMVGAAFATANRLLDGSGS